MTDEDRVLGLAAPALLPLLERRRENSLGELRAAFRLGKTDFTAQIAKYDTLCELIRDVESKLKQYEGERNAR